MQLQGYMYKEGNRNVRYQTGARQSTLLQKPLFFRFSVCLSVCLSVFLPACLFLCFGDSSVLRFCIVPSSLKISDDTTFLS